MFLLIPQPTVGTNHKHHTRIPPDAAPNQSFLGTLDRLPDALLPSHRPKHRGSARRNPGNPGILRPPHAAGISTRRQIIAFGLSTLDALSEAKITDMPPAMRLRYRGCANSLNRACQQNEKALAKLLTCEPADAAAPLSEPVNDISEGEIQQAVRQAKAKIEIIRKRLSNITTQPQDGSAMFNALFQPAPPPRSAAP
jgi:hypothetical protein